MTYNMFGEMLNCTQPTGERCFCITCDWCWCRSQDWKCEHCGYIRSLVRPVTEASQALSQEAKELGSQIKLQASILTRLIFTICSVK